MVLLENKFLGVHSRCSRIFMISASHTMSAGLGNKIAPSEILQSAAVKASKQPDNEDIDKLYEMAKSSSVGISVQKNRLPTNFARW